MSAIFISHSSKDEAAANEMKTWLVQQGHSSIFLDFDPENGIPAGRSWEKELYARLRMCKAVIVIGSEYSIASPWCFAEITLARSLGKQLFPIKVGVCTLPVILLDVQAIDLTVDAVQGYQRLGAGLREAGLDPANIFDWNANSSPYPGLPAFKERDAAIFFGRDGEIREVIEAISRQRILGTPRMTMLLGASGSGKSSLVRAGVVPRLKRNENQWLVIEPFRPLNHPLDELAIAMASTFRSFNDVRDWKSIRDHLLCVLDKYDPTPLLDLANDLRLTSGEHDASVLLVIDQFEELLGHGGEHPSHSFLRLLRLILEAPASPYIVVATLRSDFLELLQLTEEARGLAYELSLISQLPVVNFAQVIEGPASVAGLELEPGLAQAMIVDAATEDALPLLAFTLRELWERNGDDGRLTVEEYRSGLGGLQGSLDRAAEAVLSVAPLPANQEKVLCRAFLRLVRVGDHGQYGRKPVISSELPESVQGIFERFVQARLLVSRSQDGKCTIEVAHEALFRSWSRLAAWIKADEAFLQWRWRLDESMKEWQRTNYDQTSLLRGPALSETESWLTNKSDDLTTEEHEYIRLSQEHQALEDQRWKDLYEKAERQRQVAVANQLAAEAEMWPARKAIPYKQAYCWPSNRCADCRRRRLVISCDRVWRCCPGGRVG